MHNFFRFFFAMRDFQHKKSLPSKRAQSLWSIEMRICMRFQWKRVFVSEFSNYFMFISVLFISMGCFCVLTFKHSFNYSHVYFVVNFEPEVYENLQNFICCSVQTPTYTTNLIISIKNCSCYALIVIIENFIFFFVIDFYQISKETTKQINNNNILCIFSLNFPNVFGSKCENKSKY